MKNKNTTVKNSKKLNIYFTWTELPAYGYSLLKFIYLQLKKKKYPINFKVISTNTSKKKYYKEDNDFFHSIKWINPDKIYDWYDLGLEYIFLHPVNKCPSLHIKIIFLFPTVNN